MRDKELSSVGHQLLRWLLKVVGKKGQEIDLEETLGRPAKGGVARGVARGVALREGQAQVVPTLMALIAARLCIGDLSLHR